MPIVSKIISRFWPKASVSLFPAPCSPTWPWPMIHQQQHVTCERFVKEWKKEWSSASMGTWVLEKLEEPWLRKGQLLLCKTNSISKKYLPSKIHNKLSNVWQINTIVFFWNHQVSPRIIGFNFFYAGLDSLIVRRKTRTKLWRPGWRNATWNGSKKTSPMPITRLWRRQSRRDPRLQPTDGREKGELACHIFPS